MKITKEEVLKLLSAMENSGIDEATIDLSDAERFHSIDFDIYTSNGKFVFTALTLDEN